MGKIVSYDQVQELRNNPEEFARLFSDVLNVMGNQQFIKDFTEVICHRTHRTLQQVVMGVATSLIAQWAEDFKAGNYDGRNEATCKLCNKIMESHAEDMWLPFI